jgi:hypothetical protein
MQRLKASCEEALSRVADPIERALRMEILDKVESLIKEEPA